MTSKLHARIILTFSVLTALAMWECNVAFADSAKISAVSYQNCIVQMRHIPGASLKAILSKNDSLEKKANAIAMISIRTCGSERSKLIADLQSEGRTDEKYDKMILDIENGGSFYIKMHILNLTVQEKTNHEKGGR